MFTPYGYCPPTSNQFIPPRMYPYQQQSQQQQQFPPHYDMPMFPYPPYFMQQHYNAFQAYPAAFFQPQVSAPSAPYPLAPPPSSVQEPPVQEESAEPEPEDPSHEGVATVNGRCCLLSKNINYKIRKGEIKRRVEGPEELQIANVASIMRKKKGKESTDFVEGIIKKCSDTKVSRRKKKDEPKSLFTTLCEDEAVHMARDFEDYCNGLRTVNISKEALSTMTRQHYSNQVAAMNTVACARQELEGLMGQVLGALPRHPKDIHPMTPAEFAINDLSLTTHGFGHNALKSMFDVAMRVMDGMVGE